MWSAFLKVCRFSKKGLYYVYFPEDFLKFPKVFHRTPPDGCLKLRYYIFNAQGIIFAA